MITSQKYCRSLHAQISLGTTSDDRFMPNGYIKHFSKMDLILTEKLDGQNNCFTKDGLYARSHAAPSILPWDKPMRERWELIKNDLGDLEIFGENMYGVHSIRYYNLESYFYVFAIRQNGYWLSWDDVKIYAELFNFPTVPEIEIKYPLKDFYKNGLDENIILDAWLTKNLGMCWTKWGEDGYGNLNGWDVKNMNPTSEGFVIRNRKGFVTNEGPIQTAPNEFNNLFKIVRESHVKTDEHWTKNWEPAELINYSKYKWDGYSYMRDR